MQILKQIQAAVSEQMPVGRFGSAKTECLQTTLYTCTACNTTYIASEMDSCPECQAVLDEVPSGAELGYTAPKP
jgi:rubrerythrin